MAQFKFNVEAKQIFVDCYNNPEISSMDLHKQITLKLHEGGFLPPNVELSKDLVREALENKLGLIYRKRPRKKTTFEISFEEEEKEEVSVVDTEEVEEVDSEEEVAEDTSWEPRKEPVKFEF